MLIRLQERDLKRKGFREPYARIYPKKKEKTKDNRDPIDINEIARRLVKSKKFRKNKNRKAYIKGVSTEQLQ